MHALHVLFRLSCRLALGGVLSFCVCICGPGWGEGVRATVRWEMVSGKIRDRRALPPAFDLK